MQIEIGLREFTELKVAYEGEVNWPFKVQVFLRYQYPGAPEGEEADQIAIPLYEELPEQTFSFTNPEIPLPPDSAETIEEILAEGDPAKIAKLKMFIPPPVLPGGELITIQPPLKVGEPRSFTLRRYFFSYLPPGTRMALMVRADALNHVHPEHDGYHSTASIGYKYPDFVAADPPPRSNNESVNVFEL